MTTSKQLINNVSILHKGLLKSVLLALVLSLFTFNSNAQNKIGEITFDKDIIDYGNISTADSGVRTFTFTNTGDAPLTISKVKTSCGCTVPNYEKAAIMPGETGEIEVKYDTKRKGKFSKTLMVTSNASNKNVQLKIKGHITTDAVAINQ